MSTTDDGHTDSRLLTLVINMDSAPDRLAHMQDQLRAAGLTHQRIAGVDGSRLQRPHPDFSERAYRHLHGRHWAPRELGCYLSHIKALQTFLDSDAHYALILEDDVRIDPNIQQVLQAALAHRAHWNMLRLSTVNSGKWWSVRRLGAANLAVCLTREKGAGGYLVDRIAAKKMVERLLPMRLAWDIAFDLEWLLGFKTLGVYPMVIEQNQVFETQIQMDLAQIKIRGKLKYLTVAPFRAFIESSRLLYRLQRLIALKFLVRA
ncbi:MAG: hypothetical protein RI884_2816 [Pseudomonadota bacterium]